MTIIFSNPGILDPRLITTMGVNVKENSGAIGYFGTGLKYAIAVLLREGKNITIWNGEEDYAFTTKTIQIKNKEFQFIYMNKVELGFTTELGKNWGLSQAYRELYANCVDEHGEVYDADAAPTNIKGQTVIMVEGIEDIHQNRDSFILDPSKHKLFYTTPTMEVYGGESSTIFYRGFACATLDKPTKFTYNIKTQMQLTEDRSIQNIWDVKYIIREAILKSDFNSKDIASIIAAKGFFEEDISYDYISNYEVNDQFHSALQFAVTYQPNLINRSVGDLFIKFKKLDDVTFIEHKLTEQEQNKLNIATELANRVFEFDYPIHVTTSLGTSILGRALNENIYLAHILFRQSERQIASCILEEATHIQTGYFDHTPAMQTHLFELLIEMASR